MLSTLIAPDLVHYPDSGKFGARNVKGERVLLSRPGPAPRLLGRRGLALGSGFSLTSSLGRNACDSLALQPHIGLRLKPEPIGSTF